MLSLCLFDCINKRNPVAPFIENWFKYFPTYALALFYYYSYYAFLNSYCVKLLVVYKLVSCLCFATLLRFFYIFTLLNNALQ